MVYRIVRRHRKKQAESEEEEAAARALSISMDDLQLSIAEHEVPG